MNIHTRSALVLNAAIGLAVLLAGGGAAADEPVASRPPLLVVVEVDQASLRIDVAHSLRAIEASLNRALARAAAAEFKMAAIDSPPRG